MLPEPPYVSGNGVVRPVCINVCISSREISPLFSELRPEMRNSSTATLCARRRISSCSSVGAKLSMQLYPFNDHAIGHTAAFTDGLQTVATAGALQFVQEDGGKASAGSSQRVAHSNCSPVHVDPLPICPGLTLPGQYDAGECFIDFNQVYLLQRQPGALKHLKRSRDRPGQHENRIITCQGERDKARTRSQSQSLRGFSVHDEYSRRAIADLRGIASCDETIRLEGRLEASHVLKTGIRADTFVRLQHTGQAIFIFHRNGHDLAFETSFSRGLCGSTITLQAILVKCVSAYFPLLRHPVGTHS